MMNDPDASQRRAERWIFKDADAVAQGVATAFAQLISEWALTAQPGSLFHLAISGGRTPGKLFAIWAQNPAAVPWSRIAIWWVDERGVPPTDEQSNYKLANSLFLEPLGIPASQVFRMEGELDVALAAERYEALVVEHLGPNPAFDLVMLGMGDDGHTASLFPHQPELRQVDRWITEATHPQSGQPRITLSGKALIQAQVCWWLVTGADKASRVVSVWEDPASNLPAAWVHRHLRRSVWWLDVAAAAELSN